MVIAKYGAALPMYVLLAITLAGCSTKNPPLMFGDSTTFGIRLGNDTATGGASVSLGLKAQSIALVPITYNDSDGWARTLKAESNGMRDSMSVFAVFDSDAPADETEPAKSVGLGQMFATGLAAQNITEGYICRAQNDECKVKSMKADDLARNAAAAADTAAARARATAEVANAAEAGSSRSTEQIPERAPDRNEAEKVYDPGAGPYQRPLVFLRSDTFGFDIGGSLAEKGFQFVLGYNNRNLAFIPAYSNGQNKLVGRITGGELQPDNALERSPKDVFSVLGQFRANTQTSKLGYGLQRFFATGIAARNLGNAAKASIASTTPAPQKAAPEPAIQQ
ncbi:MAG: hypothetical protein QM674_10395 [Burkholderiaceae bacterium]